MIPQDVYDKATNQSLVPNDRGAALLDCIQSRLAAKPSDFTHLVVILESDPYLRSLAEQLVQSYCE